MIPLIQQEVVKRNHWVTDEEFTDILAIGNALPGPIATKIPGYIGYKVAGITGCLHAVIAVVLPMVLAMILLLTIFSQYRDVSWIEGMSFGVIPIVMVMMAQLTWDFWRKSHKAIGLLITCLMVMFAAALIYGVGIHPGIIITTLLTLALALPLRKKATT